jgi:hypothetical protein
VKVLTSISIAFILLFVVVCPFTPTPTAVVSGKAHFPQMHAVELTVLLLAAVLTPGLVFVSQLPDHPHGLISTGILDLTCTRLC